MISLRGRGKYSRPFIKVESIRKKAEEQFRQREKELQANYRTLHRILADRDFVLTVCEGEYLGHPTSYYDLFRLDQGRIVEHWDTVERIPPKDKWKNSNGKF